MTVEEFHEAMKNQPSTAFDVIKGKDLTRVEMITKPPSDDDDEEFVDPDDVVEEDLKRACKMLDDAMLLLACLIDPQLTPTLEQRDRDDMEQIHGEIRDFLDEYDGQWWKDGN